MKKNELYETIESLNIGRLEKDVLMSKHTTYKVGGKVICIVYPEDEQSLIKLLCYIKANSISYLHLKDISVIN